MFEKKHQPVLPLQSFIHRMVRHFLVAMGIVGLGLGIGVLGYHYIGALGWVDSILNASMILAGMGPVDALSSDAAKLFAAAYALFSGVLFLIGMGVMVAPVLHRFLHHFHLD
ncbi:MAG: hypothetical protein EPO06_00440 [Burkholderiaceae bacterium]|nr:MAG: hypothetical protein EPO06_00440 [Burkholderiaceae bacterium]